MRPGVTIASVHGPRVVRYVEFTGCSWRHLTQIGAPEGSGVAIKHLTDCILSAQAGRATRASDPAGNAVIFYGRSPRPLKPEAFGFKLGTNSDES